MKKCGISFIGAGKVAGTLCRELYVAGFNIVKIVSRQKENGQLLASSCRSLWSTDYSFSDDTGIIIIAVPDDVIKDVAEKIKCAKETLVIHTAGSVGMDIFPSSFRHTGVLYPLQTFSEDRMINFSKLPLFVESSDAFSASLIESIATSIGGKIQYIDTEKRRLMHLAAVFTCNFTNHMLTAGKMISEKAGISFDTMEPLIKETMSKALDIGPEKSQTGPAVRSDMGTINRHMELLNFSPELKKLYREITKSIINCYKPGDND